jgi:hypothetical protein
VRWLILIAGCLLVAHPLFGGEVGWGEWQVPGWSPGGAPRLYRGAELYGYIDGGAELFLELGFVELFVHELQRGPARVSVELYRMLDATAARGVYLAKGGSEHRSHELPTRHTPGRLQLTMQQGHLFVVITDEEGGGKVAALTAVARAVIPALPADEPVTILDLLPAAGKVPGSERILRGPLGLQSLLTLGEGDVLRLAGRATAVAADYEAGGARTGLLIVEYESDGEAMAAVDNAQAHLDPYSTVVARRPGQLLLKQHDEKFAELEVSGRRLTVRYRLPTPPVAQAR